MNIYSNQVNKYRLSKTLRFELIPQGKTLQNIQSKGLILEDEERAKDYKKAKNIIDKYHQFFIEEVLSDVCIAEDILQKYADLYFDLKKIKKDDENLEKKFKQAQEEIKKEISDHIKKSNRYKNLFKKELIKAGKNESDLVIWLNERKQQNIDLFEKNQNIKDVDEAIDIIRGFKDWTTYFTGFHDNRKNVYSTKDIPTSIIYRIVNDNLPKFLDNKQRYENLKEKAPEAIDYQQIAQDLSQELTFEIDDKTSEVRQKVFSLDDIFEIVNFNNYLNQTGITKFNSIIGGKSVAGETSKRKGINEYINLYSQQTKDKSLKNFNMSNLFKQILSYVESSSFVIDKLDSDGDVIASIKSYHQYIREFKTLEERSIKYTFVQIFDDLKNDQLDLSMIYLKKDKLLKDLSKKIFEDYRVIDLAILNYAIKQVNPKNKDNPNNKEQKLIEKQYTKAKYLSLETIKEAINEYNQNIDDDNSSLDFQNILDDFCKIPKLFNDLYEKYTNLEKNVFAKYECDPNAKKLLQTKAESDVEKIKEYLDCANGLLHSLKIFHIAQPKDKANILEKEDLFYQPFEECYFELSNITPLYNKVRNYITQKPYSNEKFKLNFEKSTLANGWDKKNESANMAILFTKQDKYFLGIMNKKHNKIFRDKAIKENKGEGYKKVVYKLFKSATLIPKCSTQLKEIRYHFDSGEKSSYVLRNDDFITPLKVTQELYNLNNNFYDENKSEKGKGSKAFKKEYLAKVQKKHKDSLNIWINFCKDFLTKYKNTSGYDYSFKRTQKYDSLDEFYRDINGQSNIFQNCIDSLVEIKQHFKTKSSSYILTNNEFNEPLEITEEIFELSNNVYDTEKGIFVEKLQNDDKRPKAFEKEYLEEVHKKYKYSLQVWIDFCKSFLTKYKSNLEYDYKFKASEKYSDLNEFYNYVDEQSYKLTFESISQDYIDSLVDEGKLHLFQIYNKDFSEYSKGKPNLHTLYWKALFDDRNLQDVVYKLNGEAELFYRKKSIDRKITHPAKELINNKNKDNPKKQSLFDYDLIKDKRFTEDKFFFHCSITMNFKAGNVGKFNDGINTLLKEKNQDVHILGIDRGERHLAYYTLLDRSGNIVKSETFNTVGNDRMKTNYHEKLDDIEKGMDDARKDWKKINNIKEMKEGYLSQVVHEIVKMVIEYNAIVVFEDLSFGFKRGRFKIEKQVYQKLEKMLIDKLNYLVFKDNEFAAAGGVLNAYQLAPKFESFAKMGKQTGIIFYVPAAYTSKICPVTGFVNQLYPKYQSVEKSQEFFKKFDKICYNSDKGYFEFSFDYKKFGDKANKGKWTIASYGSRLINFRNKDKNHNPGDTVYPTQQLKDILEKHFIEYSHGNCIKEDICAESDKSFFVKITSILNTVLQMRNSKTGTEIDYLVSPVADNQGNFFDSREAGETMPKNADANGAYHIGLKGLMLLDRLKNYQAGKKPDLLIKNEEYFEFVQNRNK